MILKEIKGLSELEKAGDWNGAVSLLYDLWLKRKENMNINFRLIGECWVTLSDCGFSIELSEEEWYRFKDILMETTNFWLKNFECVEVYSSLLGYMINLYPYLFYEYKCDNEYDEGHYFSMWEKIGKKLIKDSYKKYKENHIVRLVYFGCSRIESIFPINYDTEKKIVGMNIEKYFSKDTEFERYFVSVWT